MFATGDWNSTNLLCKKRTESSYSMTHKRCITSEKLELICLQTALSARIISSRQLVMQHRIWWVLIMPAYKTSRQIFTKGTSGRHDLCINCDPCPCVCGGGVCVEWGGLYACLMASCTHTHTHTLAQDDNCNCLPDTLTNFLFGQPRQLLFFGRAKKTERRGKGRGLAQSRHFN